MSNVDLFSLAGHDGAYSYTVENILVNDGTLNISLETLIDAGTLAGFAIYSANGKIDDSVPVSNCNGYVALTYDDGPTGNTRTFISRLKQYGLTPVTFFVNGRNINDASVIAEMLTVGEVQNHSFDHNDLGSYSQSQVHDQLNSNNQAIQNAGAPKPTLFRPPYGTLNTTINQVASSLGMRAMTWDLDSRDWNGASTSSIVSTVGQLQNGQNILLHENQANTISATAVQQMAETLKARGLCPGRIDPSTGRAVAP